jgi:hypothetical protein
MNRASRDPLFLDVNRQGAIALLSATFEFLRNNKIPDQFITDFAANFPTGHRSKNSTRLLRSLIRAYEDMGVVMGAWFSDPRFLDAAGKPVLLTNRVGSRSLASLIRASRARVEESLALKLMKRSPSVKFLDNGDVLAVRRVFVLPELEVPRAAFVLERYLNTLQRNAAARKQRRTLLLERSCHVSEIGLAAIAPLLRDIEHRGTAFIDSIDGEIEEHRLRQPKRKEIGELGVLVFAWTGKQGSAKRRQYEPPPEKPARATQPLPRKSKRATKKPIDRLRTSKSTSRKRR